MTACKRCQDKDAALAEERMYNTRQSAEISGLKMKLAQAEERVARLEGLLTEALASLDYFNSKKRVPGEVSLRADIRKALSAKEER